MRTWFNRILSEATEKRFGLIIKPLLRTLIGHNVFLYLDEPGIGSPGHSNQDEILEVPILIAREAQTDLHVVVRIFSCIDALGSGECGDENQVDRLLVQTS